MKKSRIAGAIIGKKLLRQNFPIKASAILYLFYFMYIYKYIELVHSSIL